jgi:CO/xanthine dehydrogenase FAD-binding subunit
VDVLTPRSLAEALRLKAERPQAVPIQGGTDVMVDLNFDRARPAALLNLNEVEELRGWSRQNGTVWLGSGLTYAEAMERPLAEALPALAEAARTVGGPQIRNRGTIGGNLGTSSPAGDALPPLLVCGAEVSVDVSESRQTFMKVGPRNAMVIAVVSLALRVDGESLRAAFGSAGPVATLVRADRADADSFPQRVAEAATPIDDVRGTATYRRHALHILTRRALDRCLA